MVLVRARVRSLEWGTKWKILEGGEAREVLVKKNQFLTKHTGNGKFFNWVPIINPKWPQFEGKSKG